MCQLLSIIKITCLNMNQFVGLYVNRQISYIKRNPPLANSTNLVALCLFCSQEFVFNLGISLSIQSCPRFQMATIVNKKLSHYVNCRLDLAKKFFVKTDITLGYFKLKLHKSMFNFLCVSLPKQTKLFNFQACTYKT